MPTDRQGDAALAVRRFAPGELRVDHDEAMRYLGYKGQEVDEGLSARVGAQFARCEQLSSPGYAFRVFDAEERADGIALLGSSLVLTGDDIREHLHGAVRVAVMACTLGLSNERELRRLSHGSAVDLYAFDAAGSSLVEVAGDACNARIVALAHEQGLFTNWRFSPGYGDLPLSLQPKILRVLDAQTRLGMSVSDSLMLVPTKSTTAFVGMFTTKRDDKRSCANCQFKEFCELRKAGTPCYR